MVRDSAEVRLAHCFSQVLQFDTTFKDNAWRYPLLEITATTNEMNTFVIAQALIPSESEEILLWVIEQLDECLLDNGRYAPSVVLTDLAKGFKAAFRIARTKGI